METTSAFRLVAAVQELSLARDFNRLLEIVGRAARELTGADGATLVLRDGPNCHYVGEDAIGPLWKGKRFPLESCVSGWVMEKRRALAIEDIYLDPRIPVDAYRHTFVKSLVLVPIRKLEPIGAIGTYWAARHQATSADVQLLQALADATSVAMENIQVYSELEERIRNRTAQLEAANRDLDAFSYTVSHDLRAPVRHITGFAELLAASGGCNEQAMHYVQRIQGAATRMSGLIEAMLNLAKISMRDMHRRPVDLSQIAREVVAGLSANAPARKIACEIAPNLTVDGDPGLLRIALENLLGNAWKFTTKTPAPRIEFGATAGTPAEYYVRDNGAGFAMENAERLFQPFARMHAEHDFEGNGIGLATVRRIVLKHAGSIRAESAVNRGATFFFTLG
jgi:signal transduction histidine kinase